MNLELAAAKVVLGRFNSEELIVASNHALDTLFSDSLSELATSMDLTSEEAGKLLRRSFQELGMEWPSYKNSLKMLVAFWLNRIAQNEINSREGVGNLVNDVLQPAKALDAHNRYVGDKLNLERILGAFSSYDDIEENIGSVNYAGRFGGDAIKEIDRDIIAESVQWLKKYADGK